MGMLLTRLITSIATKRKWVILMCALWRLATTQLRLPSKMFPMIVFRVLMNLFVLNPYLMVRVFVALLHQSCSSPKGECLKRSPWWEISLLFSSSFVFLLQFWLLFCSVFIVLHMFSLSWANPCGCERLRSSRNTSWLIDPYRRQLGQRNKKDDKLFIRWKLGFQ